MSRIEDLQWLRSEVIERTDLTPKKRRFFPKCLSGNARAAVPITPNSKSTSSSLPYVNKSPSAELSRFRLTSRIRTPALTSRCCAISSRTSGDGSRIGEEGHGGTNARGHPASNGYHENIRFPDPGRTFRPP